MSVSLLAVAAFAASVLLTRKVEKMDEFPPGEQQPAEHSLDAIRAAGL